MNTEQGERGAVPPPPAAPPKPVPPKPSAPPKPSGPPRPSAPPKPSGPPGDAPAGGDGEESPPTLTLRAVRGPGPRRGQRLLAPVVCLVLGTGLLGGAATGAWLTGEGDGRSAAQTSYDDGRSLWRDVPIGELFPAGLTGQGAGPGGADRRWMRVAVAPDSGCSGAFDPLLEEVLATVGCHRLVRATYVDETGTIATTVGLLFTRVAAADMRALAARFRAEDVAGRPDLMPGTYAPAGTVAERFGDAQRAAWTVRPLTELPVVAFAVSGFADGRTVTEPQPAAEARERDQDTTAALAGLGHDADGIADRVVSGLRSAAGSPGSAEEP